MSELDTAVEQPDPVTPPVEEQAVVPPEEQEPEQTVTTPGGEKLVPLEALQEVRREAQALKQRVGTLTALESEVQELRGLKPYADFLKANPHLLQQPQPPAAPQPQGPDPELEQYARRFDLYTADGKPDVQRAQAIREDTAKIARQEAERLIRPVETQTLAARAAQNLNWIGQQKDPYGRPITEQAIAAAVAPLISGMTEEQRIKAMADPKVTQLILQHAKVAMIEQHPNAPIQPPQTPPLHVETPGGGSRVVLSDMDKRLGAKAGLSEQQLRDRAARFNPRGSNVLED